MRAYGISVGILAAVLVFSLWNSSYMTASTARWRDQLQQADAQAQSESWTEAVDTLAGSYDDWSESQTYLHIVARHDTVDDAEAMYRRALAFAATRELTEFRAEVSDLRDQLRLLAETERLRNVDQVAYVRFASVYRQFKDIDTFMTELNKLLADNR